MKFFKNIMNGTVPIVIAEKEKVKEAKVLEKLDLGKIISVTLPDNQYIRQKTKKKQIVIHHTVSGQGVHGDLSWWRQTTDRVGTAIIVSWDGKIYQCFGSKYWAYHLGVHTNNTKLNKGSIGIEIDAWGGLVKKNKSWYPATYNKDTKKFIANTGYPPIKNVQEYSEGFRGFYGFEKYTDAQIESVRQLLVFWGERYDIPLDYKADMWDYSNEAMAGEAGIWSHVSYRLSKSDCHPQPELIAMLKALK